MKSVIHLIAALLLLSGCAKTIAPQQLFKDVKELSDDKYQGRKVGTEGNKQAAEYIVKRFKGIGLRAYASDYKKPFSFTDRTGTLIPGTNLVGYIPGKKKEAIVISAHYDHIGVINGAIHNGADDNASGIGGLLAIAKHFSKTQPEHTLVFAAFDAEEAGLQGAKAFVTSPPLDKDCLQLNINLDMISRSDKSELFAVGTFHHPSLKGHIVTTNPNIKILFGHDDPKLGTDDWTNLSDHGAFHAKKIPFLYFGVEDHPDYHKPTDDFSKINKEFYQNAVSAITEIIQNIDKSVTIHKIYREKVIMK